MPMVADRKIADAIRSSIVTTTTEHNVGTTHKFGSFHHLFPKLGILHSRSPPLPVYKEQQSSDFSTSGENIYDHRRMKMGKSGPRIGLGCDNDTATTASVTTSISSPAPSTFSNTSFLDDGEEETIDFVLDNASAWNFAAAEDSRSEEGVWNTFDKQWEKYEERITRGMQFGREKHDHECDGHVSDDCDDDDLSFTTPILDNTNRQHAFMSTEKASTMTTTTTEIKTKTTTTTQTITENTIKASELSTATTTSVPANNSSEGMFFVPNDFSQNNESDRSFVQPAKVQGTETCGNTAMVPCHDCEENSAAFTFTIPGATNRQAFSKCCASKQRIIERQGKELRHMNVMMKKLCGLLADTVRSQKIGNDKDDVNNRIGFDESCAAKQKSITHPSHNEIVPARTGAPEGTMTASPFFKLGEERSRNNDEYDSNSVATTVSAVTSSSSSLSSLPLSTPRIRITSLPVTSVGTGCPRTKNQRIKVGGQWGTYSGPSLGGRNENDQPLEAGIFQGCVVRMDEGDLYVGSLSRNDTGSFTFQPPGTLYDQNRTPKRRLR